MKHSACICKAPCHGVAELPGLFKEPKSYIMVPVSWAQLEKAGGPQNWDIPQGTQCQASRRSCLQFVF